ncbi:MAG: hypothetical protein ACXQTD_07485 [Candidatus Syntropharchaeia archaeon]
MFIFEQKFGWKESMALRDLFLRGVRERRPFAHIQEELRELGLSYRRKDMLEDYRRAGAIAFARDYEARVKAERWFEKFFEPARKKTGLTGRKFMEYWEETKRKWEEGESLTPEQEALVDMFDELYE